MIEANRDEALRCASIALRALEEGDVAKADKFAQKGERLFHCKEVAEAMARVQSVKAGADQAARQQSGAAAGGAQGGAEADETTDTPEQRKMVADILAAKDLYEVLGLPRTCDDDDIKKAYRKLALKLHPDKNKAAHAEEAFKAVSKAFSCLSDGDKRASYDSTLGKEPGRAAAAAAAGPRRKPQQKQQQQQQQAGPAAGGAAGPGEPQGIDADVILDTYFRGKQPRQAMQELFQRARSRREQEEQQQRDAKQQKRRKSRRKESTTRQAAEQADGEETKPKRRRRNPKSTQERRKPRVYPGESEEDAAKRREKEAARMRAWRLKRKGAGKQEHGSQDEEVPAQGAA